VVHPECGCTSAACARWPGEAPAHMMQFRSTQVWCSSCARHRKDRHHGDRSG
jgi:hypothetical protein